MGINAEGRRIRAAASQVSVVAVAAKDQAMRVRMAGALAGRDQLAVRAHVSTYGLTAGDVLGDVLVLHFDAVCSDELHLITRLRRTLPELLIVVVCHSTNGRSARRAVDAGVDGLVFVDHLETALLPTIEALLAGQTAVPRELRACVRKPSLTSREKQVLGMVVMGFSNGEIGRRLFLAESTVKSHLCSAFNKLGVRSRSEAAALILDPHGSLGTGILAITGHDPAA